MQERQTSLVGDVQTYCEHVKAGLVVIGSQLMTSSKPTIGSLALNLVQSLTIPVMMVKVGVELMDVGCPEKRQSHCHTSTHSNCVLQVCFS